METTVKKKPKTIAELLPALDGVLSPSTVRDIRSTVKKNPRSTIAESTTRTSEKLKPMTIAQMFSHVPAFETKSPRKTAPMSASSIRKWNSSTKMVNKIVSHTSNEQLRHHSVRKVLNFQPSKPKVVKSFSNSRATMMNAETPKFPKPEVRVKKPLYQLARNNVRVSGICNIPESPVAIKETVKSRMTIANKENIRNWPVIRVTTPKSSLRKKVLASMIPDTPISNESEKSSGDDSFLQNERDINNLEKQEIPRTNKSTLENIAEVSPPLSPFIEYRNVGDCVDNTQQEIPRTNKSTLENIAEVSPPLSPFIEYRNVGDYVDNTHSLTENTYHDNTIMSLDNTVCKDNSKKEESIIISLCEMLNKATVTSYKQSTELEHLLETRKQIESSLKIVETGISSLMMIKEAQLKSLEHIKKLIPNKTERKGVNLKKKNMPNESTPKNENKASSMSSSFCSGKKVNPKQLAYKIPKKTPCSKKKVIYETQLKPNLPSPKSPQKPLGDKALSMYLQMKERNNYLTTPVVKRQPQPSMVPNTPALTSLNLQQQLDRLYEES